MTAPSTGYDEYGRYVYPAPLYPGHFDELRKLAVAPLRPDGSVDYAAAERLGIQFPVKSKWLAAALSAFLAVFGAGNFYLRNTGRGIIQLAFGFIVPNFLTSNEASIWNVLIYLLALAVIVWGIVEAVFIITGKRGYDRDGMGNPVS